MKSLIERFFEIHYQLDNNVSIFEQNTTERSFDLDDDQKPNYIVRYTEGIASFTNNKCHDIQVLDYENYITSFENRPSFTNHRRRCDFIMEDKVGNAIILCELASSSRGMSGLMEPMEEFQGGKFEKVEKQLADSLETLACVPQIKDYFDSLAIKVCLCSYKLFNMSKLSHHIQSTVMAFNRYLKVEEYETGENGAELESKRINNLGFVYKRISHNYSFIIN